MVIGIDLGTTYSASACLGEDKKPKILSSSEGGNTTPSVVLFEAKKQIVVGEVARDNAVMRPRDTVAAVKNFMGKKKEIKSSCGDSYTPEMISSFILRKLVSDSAVAMGAEVTGAVVTVPAYFTDAQRKATEDAAAMAGINLLGLLNEPTAAALCYTVRNQIRGEHLLVYDLGGGTFDVTILAIDSDGKIHVRSTGGLSNAGGRFFDESLVTGIVRLMEEKHGIDLEDDNYMDELQELFAKVEQAKRQLSSRETVAINLKIDKVREQIVITRQQLEEIMEKTYARTEGRMLAALKDAGLKKEEINKVLLVGGSTRSPYIVQRIRDFIGKEPSHEVNPDEAVALGAAIYAGMLEDNKQTDRAMGTAEENFHDVSSHSIGVIVTNHQTGEEENTILIARNSQLPASSEQRFKLMQADQKRIELKITEGEFKELTDVTQLGIFDMVLPENLPLHTGVLIRLQVDRYQLVQIHVELPEQAFSRDYQLTRAANMGDDAVQEATGLLLDYAVS